MGGSVGSGDGWRGDRGDKVVIASFSEPFHAESGGGVDACCRCLLCGRVEITVCFVKTPPPPTNRFPASWLNRTSRARSTNSKRFRAQSELDVCHELGGL